VSAYHFYIEVPIELREIGAASGGDTRADLAPI
jgi:hypothetical protein